MGRRDGRRGRRRRWGGEVGMEDITLCWECRSIYFCGLKPTRGISRGGDYIVTAHDLISPYRGGRRRVSPWGTGGLRTAGPRPPVRRIYNPDRGLGWKSWGKPARPIWSPTGFLADRWGTVYYGPVWGRSPTTHLSLIVERLPRQVTYLLLDASLCSRIR